MKGLEAILYHHGFSVAAAGITIVFTALVTLAVILSQLHRVLSAWDNRKAYFEKARRMFSSPGASEPMPVVTYFDDIHESARQFNLLIRTMGEPFSLPKLIHMAETLGISHAHSTASHLIVTHLIVPDQKGYFRWNQEAYQRLTKKDRG